MSTPIAKPEEPEAQLPKPNGDFYKGLETSLSEGLLIESSLVAICTSAEDKKEGAPPTLPVPASGDHASAMGLYSAIVTGLYRRERTGEGCYVTTSLLGEGIGASAVLVQAALCDAKFYPRHDRKSPPKAIFNVYQTSDNRWFLIVMQPKDWPALPAAIGRPELLSDPRFADDTARAKTSEQLAAILDEVFAAQPLAHWHDTNRACPHHIWDRQDPRRSYNGSPGSHQRDHRADRRRW
jgi:crotonobetainyl-CoA:carnitine CoA-transferase CaiB-like acyl-CoA transferase